MPCETDFSDIRDNISELKVSQARAEEKIEGLNVRFGDFAKRQETIETNISQIKDSVVASDVKKASLTTDTVWLKKIATLILTALLSGGVIGGYFKMTEPVAAEVKEILDGVDNDRGSESRGTGNSG